MEEVRNRLKGREDITCKEAHQLASEYGIPPKEVGEILDELKVKIVQCQLGLFGYGAKKKDVPFLEKIDEGIQEEIKRRLREGRLRCLDAWEIADGYKVQRKVIGGACDRLGIKIAHCQLGAF